MNRYQRRFNRAMKKGDKMKRRYWNTWVSPNILITFAFTIILVIFVYKMHQFDTKTRETEYKLVTMQVNSYDTSLANQADNIVEIINDQYELSDDLYKYTVEAVNSVGDEVATRVFRKEFPTDDDFYNDRTNGVVKIYAFLDKYPEIKCQDMVLYAIGNIDTNKVELKNKIGLYNTNVDFYIFWANQWNDSSYIVNKEGKIDAHKYPYRDIE